MRTSALLLLLAPALALGCGTSSINPSELAPIDGYEAWFRTDVTGEIPGHGDTYRIIYVNDVGRSYSHAGRYPFGTVLVKEIHSKTESGEAGDLRYLGIMRKVGDDAAGELDAPVEGGWVFTQKKGDSERHLESCWATCHIQAPRDGAWFDYGE